MMQGARTDTEFQSRLRVMDIDEVSWQKQVVVSIHFNYTVRSSSRKRDNGGSWWLITDESGSSLSSTSKPLVGVCPCENDHIETLA